MTKSKYIEAASKNRILMKWMRRIYKNINGRNGYMTSETMAEFALKEVAALTTKPTKRKGRKK